MSTVLCFAATVTAQGKDLFIILPHYFTAGLRIAGRQAEVFFRYLHRNYPIIRLTIFE